MAETSPALSDQPTFVLPDDVEQPLRPSPIDFDAFVPWACYQLGVEQPVVVTRCMQRQYVSALTKDRQKSKSKSKKPPAESITEVDVSSVGLIGSKMGGDAEEQEITIHVLGTYDDNLDLVQVMLLNNKRIPRLVFKVIGLAIPFHKSLTSLVVNKGIYAEGIYDISKYFSSSRLTEVCLDRTYIAEANYHLLLDNECLLHLSLSKCYINDTVVETIASKLNASCPAAKSLSALNLSTNRITDVGAKYLADALRTNRRLCYLNLSDNRITDVGAIAILDVLTEFKLTEEERKEKSARIVAFIKAKNELIAKTLHELRYGDYDKKAFTKKKAVKPTTSRRRPDKDTSPNVSGILEANYAERAESIADEIMGAFIDPYSPENTRSEENGLICFGNNTLAYLNLAFNNLSYASVKKLLEVLKKQDDLNRKPKGLINVRIEGNYLPESCKELHKIDDLLLVGLGHKIFEPLKKRALSRTFK